MSLVHVDILPAASIAIHGVSLLLDSPQCSGHASFLLIAAASAVIGPARRAISVDQGLQAPVNGAPQLAGGSEPTLTYCTHKRELTVAQESPLYALQHATWCGVQSIVWSLALGSLYRERPKNSSAQVLSNEFTPIF